MSLYTFRHPRATLCVAASTPLTVFADLLGRSTILRTAEMHVRGDRAVPADWMQRYAQALGNADTAARVHVVLGYVWETGGHTVQNRILGFAIISVAVLAAVLALANAEGYRPAFGFVLNLQRAQVVIDRYGPPQRFVQPSLDDCGLRPVASDSPLFKARYERCVESNTRAEADARELAQTPTRQVFFEQSLGNTLAMCLGLGLVGIGVVFFRKSGPGAN